MVSRRSKAMWAGFAVLAVVVILGSLWMGDAGETEVVIPAGTEEGRVSLQPVLAVGQRDDVAADPRALSLPAAETRTADSIADEPEERELRWQLTLEFEVVGQRLAEVVEVEVVTDGRRFAEQRSSVVGSGRFELVRELEYRDNPVPLREGEVWGTLAIEVTADGLESLLVWVPLDGEQPPDVRRSLTLKRGGEVVLTGFVEGTLEPASLFGANFQLLEPFDESPVLGRRTFFNGYADEDGRLTIRGLTPGRWLVRTHEDRNYVGYDRMELTVDGVANFPHRIELATLDPEDTLTGRVDFQRLPAPPPGRTYTQIYQLIRLEPRGGNALLGTDGRFWIVPRSEGPETWVLVGPGRVPVSEPFSGLPGQTVELKYLSTPPD